MAIITPLEGSLNIAAVGGNGFDKECGCCEQEEQCKNDYDFCRFTFKLWLIQVPNSLGYDTMQGSN
jgi:hypothetical protein